MDSYVDKIASMEDEVLLLAALNHGRAWKCVSFLRVMEGARCCPGHRIRLCSQGLLTDRASVNRAGAGALALGEMDKGFGWSFDYSDSQLIVTEQLDAKCFPGQW